ncbi:pigment-dispersing hormone type 1-like [Macrobrachium rosenbergii]|uniref:pigment-dispersing hormone type 1-like n=1 Tax=Macrobrachium rosenbergii TaxID=79674 RepID=UPI0034D5ADA2
MQIKFVAVMVVMMAAICCMAAAQQDDLQITERQIVAELAAQILRVTHGPWGASVAQKRNSGMINSILGIPKVMAEAGKK